MSDLAFGSVGDNDHFAAPVADQWKGQWQGYHGLIDLGIGVGNDNVLVPGNGSSIALFCIRQRGIKGRLPVARIDRRRFAPEINYSIDQEIDAGQFGCFVKVLSEKVVIDNPHSLGGFWSA